MLSSSTPALAGVAGSWWHILTLKDNCVAKQVSPGTQLLELKLKTLAQCWTTLPCAAKVFLVEKVMNQNGDRTFTLPGLILFITWWTTWTEQSREQHRPNSSRGSRGQGGAQVDGQVGVQPLVPAGTAFTFAQEILPGRSKSPSVVLMFTQDLRVGNCNSTLLQLQRKALPWL